MALIGGTPGDDNLHGTGFADQIFAKEGNDTLWGHGGNDQLYGETGHDTLYGGPGNDTHNGGTGNDFMHGERGDDSYYVDSGGDIVFEYAGHGKDTVYSYIHTYTLPGNVENLSLYGNARFGYGNSLNNDMKGFSNTGENRLYGRSGNDTLSGNAGVDHLYGENNNDLLKGLNGDDSLSGGAHDDTLYGNYGNDKLDGGNNDDLLYGGRGIDTLSGGSGNDTLWGTDSISHNDIDELSGGANADTFALGTKRAVHYWKGDGYALIEDFNRFEDKIQLAGNVNRSDYSLGVGNWDGGGLDTGIYYQNDLIGVVSDELNLDLNDPHFEYSV